MQQLRHAYCGNRSFFLAQIVGWERYKTTEYVLPQISNFSLVLYERYQLIMQCPSILSPSRYPDYHAS